MENQEKIDLIKESCRKLNIPYRETDIGIRASLKTPSEEGPVRLELVAELNSKSEVYFQISGQIVDYSGEDIDEAISALKTSKILYDS